MAGFARTILAAHEEAAGYFTGSDLRGRLRFGVTDDLALTPLPRILRDFRQLYPRIDLELTVAQSPNLLRRVESGHLDLAYVKHSVGTSYEPSGRLVRRDPLVWAGINGTRIAPDGPVPLVAYQAPSLSRSLGVKTLEEAGRSCRITCIVRGVNGVLAAVRAGLGIGIFARSLMPADLVEPPPSAGLPELPAIDLVLITNPRASKQPAEALTAAILGSNAPLKPDAG
jgi:DNA-binding transcriptional LysR family regulator